MVDSDDLYGPMEVDDDLSTALGTETLTYRDMMPPDFDNTPGSSADTLPIEIFEHRKFSMGLRYSFYTCNVRGVRESLQQCKEADHTGEKCLGK